VPLADVAHFTRRLTRPKKKPKAALNSNLMIADQAVINRIRELLLGALYAAPDEIREGPVLGNAAPRKTTLLCERHHADAQAFLG
jgi:hypothetical protein